MTGNATKPEQFQALGISTLAFTLCFAVWTIFSIIGIQIAEELALSNTQLGLLMATPILTGSVSRLFLGIWTDRYGGRWVFGILMLTTSACVYLLTFATTYLMLLVGALGVGLAGGAHSNYLRHRAGGHGGALSAVREKRSNGAGTGKHQR